MSDVAVRVENLGKCYRIGQAKSGDLRESFDSWMDKLRGRSNGNGQQAESKEFWALKDINFEIKRGEAVGIIGRNGAGKSTLLKILSRITEPTRGRFEINGRVSSLLEVGTGFHPELSGRENIYLNGTILGMKRREIKDKFDEIVAFSGVEKFIDTSVKHYSSGMKVRLAFSVAAHLEPEILIIDEVLAVGDSIFQKKCLDKMSEVAEEGRTILFVSHNMQAVKNLCENAILLESGIVARKGKVGDIIDSYLAGDSLKDSNFYSFENVLDRKGKGGLKFKCCNLNKSVYCPGDSLELEIQLMSDGQKYDDLVFGINIYDSQGQSIFHLSNLFLNDINVSFQESSKYQFLIPNLNLKKGKYYFNLFLRANEIVEDWVLDRIPFTIEEGNIYGFNNSSMIQGVVQPHFEFLVEK